jgi:hypothetical protein
MSWILKLTVALQFRAMLAEVSSKTHERAVIAEKSTTMSEVLKVFILLVSLIQNTVVPTFKGIEFYQEQVFLLGRFRHKSWSNES